MELSRSRFCEITAQASYYLKSKCRWRDGFRNHFLTIRSGKYLLVNSWNRNEYCSVYVIPDHAPAHSGPEVPEGYIRVYADGDWSGPEVPEGYIRVYADGDWIADGPWQEDIPRIINELEREATAAKKAAEKEKLAAREAARQRHNGRMELARSIVSKTEG